MFSDMAEVSISLTLNFMGNFFFYIKNNASLQLFKILIAVFGFSTIYKKNNSGTICLFLK